VPNNVVTLNLDLACVLCDQAKFSPRSTRENKAEDMSKFMGSSTAFTALFDEAIQEAYTIRGHFAAVPLKEHGHRQRVLLGRAFLRACRLVYDGRSGKVTVELNL
jgi:hypothetical protein